jgi:hypothetical protein
MGFRLCLHPRHDQPIATSNPISSPESDRVREREGGREREREGEGEGERERLTSICHFIYCLNVRKREGPNNLLKCCSTLLLLKTFLNYKKKCKQKTIDNRFK